MNTPAPTRIDAGLVDNLVQNTDHSLNLGGRIITTTEDKVRLALREHLDRMESRYGWITPASIFIAVVLAFATTDFKDAFMVSAATWRAFFMFVGAASFIVMVIALFQMARAPTIEDFLSKLRAQPVRPEPLVKESDVRRSPAAASITAHGIVKPAPEPAQTAIPAVRVEPAEPAAAIPLSAMLRQRVWVLVYNPRGKRAKRITFLASGAVGDGQNNNEHTWRINEGRLEILQVHGRVHSRFAFDERAMRFSHIDSPDTPLAKGQYIVLLDEAARLPELRGVVLG